MDPFELDLARMVLERAKSKALQALDEAERELRHIRRAMEDEESRFPVCGRYGSEMQRLHEALGAYDAVRQVMSRHHPHLVDRRSEEG